MEHGDRSGGEDALAGVVVDVVVVLSGPPMADSIAFSTLVGSFVHITHFSSQTSVPCLSVAERPYRRMYRMYSLSGEDWLGGCSGC